MPASSRPRAAIHPRTAFPPAAMVTTASRTPMPMRRRPKRVRVEPGRCVFVFMGTV
nr:MAG TPA: hypothetical protein [Caudoviricetes sp.]